MASTPWRANAPSSPTVRVCRCALLAALALALAALESLIPMPMPVPGMKLGIANIVTVVAAFWLGPADAVVVLLVRIVLAAMLTGQLATLPFSLAGGALALVVTVAFVHFSSSDRVRLAAMAAAVAHNVGQIAVAVLVTATPAIAFYLPVLLLTGLVAGFLTGSVADAVLRRVPQPKAYGSARPDPNVAVVPAPTSATSAAPTCGARTNAAGPECVDPD